MEQANIGPRIIKLATGWEVGKDGMWKYEMYDKIKFTDAYKNLDGDSQMKLVDAIEAKEYFEMYPSLKEATIQKTMGIDGNSGWMNYEDQIISLNDNFRNRMSILVHELQHWVQNEEGFETGSNLTDALHQLPMGELIELRDATVDYYEKVLASRPVDSDNYRVSMQKMRRR